MISFPTEVSSGLRVPRPSTYYNNINNTCNLSVEGHLSRVAINTLVVKDPGHLD